MPEQSGHEGRTYIVTGAAAGLGRAYADLLVQSGANVVANDVAFEDGAPQYPSIRLVTGDVGATGTAEKLVRMALSEFGRVDGAVANAGAIRSAPLWETEDGTWDEVLRSHLWASFALTRALMRCWLETPAPQSSRSLVFVTSGAGLHGASGQTPYVAAKAGIAALTISTAREARPYRVRVNAIAPLARTPATERSPLISAAMSAQDGVDPWAPEHVAEVVAYLLGPHCGFSGAVLSVVGPKVEVYEGWELGKSFHASGDCWSPQELRTTFSALAPWRPRLSQMHHLFPPASGGE